MFSHNLFWYDYLPSDWIPYALKVFPSLRMELETLQDGTNKSFHSANHFNWFDERIKEDIMPRAKRKSNENASNTPKRPTGNCQWVNVRLEDEDVLELSERDFTADDLIGWVIDMSRVGADIGVKWADDGASRMAYCIIPDTETYSCLLGISAYGADAYDALCALVFKVDVKLERVFTRPSEATKPRFR